MKMEQSVPKRRHIKFIGRGINQMIEYEHNFICYYVCYWSLMLTEKQWQKAFGHENTEKEIWTENRQDVTGD